MSQLPVLILQHLSTDGPGYLASWLRQQGVPFHVFNTQADQAFPASLDGYRALAILGGEMSANDELPSLRQAEALFLQAVQRGVPTLGHCLGGQLMARALGATVGPSRAPEVGWHRLSFHNVPQARQWFGPRSSATVFHWHYEAFSLPPGAVSLATSAACPHQAFALGPHLAMQFHLEIDEAKLMVWSQEDDPDYLAAQRECATVHSGAAMREAAAAHLHEHQALAAEVYTRWMQLSA
jgi:GMP synthase (glutamine-hydrolysing)